MFWRLTALSASSPVESVLDKENFTLEELLDEEEIIQECKALNSRLINFLRDRAQVEQLLRYIVEDPPEDADSKRAFKFPFISCEIFTFEIDVILKTLVEEEELMNLLFSFLESNRQHSTMLAGYFSKVIVCLMIRKTVPLMNYVQAHQDVFRQLVDLIGITSIMEVLVRLVGADDHVYPNFIDVMQWLSESNLLEMIVDKLSPSNCPEVHGNAAETLSAVIRNAPSPLASKLSSQSFVARIFDHALEDSNSKSGLVHSLSVCISLLDPKRSTAYSSLFHSYRNQHAYERPIPVNQETISAMLPKLGDLLELLHVSSDEKILPTPYGELRPPLGKHRLKIVEFVSVLLKTGNGAAEIELVSSGIIKRIIDLFFEYPFNNFLHHHVESIILSCLESNSDAVVDHLLQECDLVGKFLQVDKNPIIVEESNEPTVSSSSKRAPRAGNIGHITRISNKLIQLGTSQGHICMYLQERTEWNDWQATSLQERNAVENVYRWACGRPTMLQDRTRDSDEDDPNDRDYDLSSSMANNVNQTFGYNIYGSDSAEQVLGALDRDDGDVYFNEDEESAETAELYLSALRLGDDKGSLFTNSNWFAFEDDRAGSSPLDLSSSELMDEINLNGTPKSGDSSSDDEVVVGEDDEVVKMENSLTNSFNSSKNIPNGLSAHDSTSIQTTNPASDMGIASQDLGDSRFETSIEQPYQGDSGPLPDWVAWDETSEKRVVGSSTNPFEDHDKTNLSCSNLVELTDSEALSPSWGEMILSNALPTSTGSSDGSSSSNSSQKFVGVRSLFEEDMEFVGVEPKGTEKAMELALKEGIVGEAGPLKREINPNPKVAEKEITGGETGTEFNDANYWRVDHQELTVSE